MNIFDHPPESPFELFRNWYASAADVEQENASFLEKLKSRLQEGAYSAFGLSNAVSLATADSQGRPSCRVVLFKELDESDEFVFYTNYESRKAKELSENPFAALTFYWPLPIRQIRVNGKVKKVAREKSVEYWNSRPRGSQIAGSISNQSHEVKSREELENAFQEIDQRYDGQSIPCPENWGGFSVDAETIEFWQGRVNRLHDRIVYRQAGSEWQWLRLAP